MISKLYYDLVDIIGEDKSNNIVIANLKPKDMLDSEIEILMKLVDIMKKRRYKSTLTINKRILYEIENLIGTEKFNGINICGVTANRLDNEEAECILELIKNIKLRDKNYKVVNNHWKLVEDVIYVTFDYHPYLIKMISSVPSAKWNKDCKAWLVHISDWPLVEEIFRITQNNIEDAYLKWKENNKINRLRIDNKGCYLTGLNLPNYEIHMATSFPDQNAQHSKAFKNGTWDGRIALYEKGNGFFPYGLLQKVINVLEKNNCQYELIDERVRPEKQHNFQLNVNLRDYQKLTIEKAMKTGHGIIQLATGAGKTKTASAMVSLYGLDTIFFVHTKFLLTQAKEALEEVLNTRVGQVGAGIIDIQPVSVAMVQTTIKALGGKYVPSEDDCEGDIENIEDDTDITGKEEDILNMLNSANLIFFDECQFVAAETFYTIANYCPAYCKFGLSATPYRSDKKDMMIEAALGQIIHKVNASYLIKRGFLTKPKIHFFKVGSGFQRDQRKYQTIYREDIVENQIRNQIIVENTKKLIAKNRSVLILCQQVVHGKILQTMFLEAGINVEFVYGEDDLEKREYEVKKLRYKKVLVLIASTIADEGLDIPTLDAVVLAGGGKSPCKSMQRVGRSIRIFKQREEAIEILNSLNELKNENKNSIILVNDVERGHNIQNHCANNGIDFIFNTGEEFMKNKKTIFNLLETKKNLFIMVHINDITFEEINNIKPLDSVILSGEVGSDISKLNRLPENVTVDILDSTDTTNLLNKLKDIQYGSLILVDDSSFGKILKQELKNIGLKSKFITGKKQTEEFEDIFSSLQNKKQIFIVNSNSIDRTYDYHLIDNIYIFGDNKTPFKSISKIEKDIRIFTLKDEAFVIDFLDCSKYLYDHSLERKLMYKTEEEFILSGWK